jgi:hypothetical protein
MSPIAGCDKSQPTWTIPVNGRDSNLQSVITF